MSILLSQLFHFIRAIYRLTIWAVRSGDHRWIHDLGWAPVGWAWWRASLGWEPGHLASKWEGWNILCLLLTAGWGVPVAGLAGWVGGTLVGAVLEVVSGGGKEMSGCGAVVALELESYAAAAILSDTLQKKSGGDIRIILLSIISWARV